MAHTKHHLKEILGPLKAALKLSDIDVRTQNVSISEFVLVQFYQHDVFVMEMKIDCRNLTQGDVDEIKNQLFTMLRFIDANWALLYPREIEFMFKLYQADDGTLYFDNKDEIPNFTGNLKHEGFIDIQFVDDGWFAILTRRGGTAITFVADMFGVTKSPTLNWKSSGENKG